MYKQINWYINNNNKRSSKKSHFTRLLYSFTWGFQLHQQHVLLTKAQLVRCRALDDVAGGLEGEPERAVGVVGAVHTEDDWKGNRNDVFVRLSLTHTQHIFLQVIKAMEDWTNYLQYTAASLLTHSPLHTGITNSILFLHIPNHQLLIKGIIISRGQTVQYSSCTEREKGNKQHTLRYNIHIHIHIHIPYTHDNDARISSMPLFALHIWQTS